MPNRIHATQIPDSVVGMITTAVSAPVGASVADTSSPTFCGKIQTTPEELVEGRPSQFSEEPCREKCRIHLTTIQDVKATDDGAMPA